MGQVAAYLLAKHGRADVRVTSRSDAKARKAADEVNKRIGSDLVKYEAVDVDNPDDLKRSMRNADIVVNCVGPYYKYGINTIKAAIDEGVPVPVLTTALYERFASRGEADYQDKLLSAMRFGFGGHLEKAGVNKT